MSDVGSRGGAEGEVIGLTRGLSELHGILNRVAVTDATVLLQGETGTGKDRIACEIHRRSRRADHPLIITNCAAIPGALFDSELFGYEVGAFTGAARRRIGRIEQADGGTLVLDEVGDLAPDLQVKLLRVLQERQIERLGGDGAIAVDFRLIAATHRDLRGMVEQGRFRADLYYRLAVVPLVLPPLRERPDDIVPLAEHALRDFAEAFGKRLDLTLSALERLRRYSWPGNVRELRSVMERAAVVADGDGVIDSDDLMFYGIADGEGCVAGVGVDSDIARDEREKLVAALRYARGNKAEAARRLRIPRTTLLDRLRRLGM
ncbi:MAG: sigma 54-interacting transcriptional regulator [Kofleriaceae bacterium]